MKCSSENCYNKASFKIKLIFDPFGEASNSETHLICNQCYEDENPNHKEMIVFDPEMLRDQIPDIIDNKSYTFIKKYKKIRK